MEKFFLVLVFAISLFLKVSNAAGAESELGGEFNACMADGRMAMLEGQVPVVTEPLQDPASTASGSVTDTGVLLASGEPNNDAAMVLTSSHAESSKDSAAISPLIGGTAYNGNWYDHVKNSYTFGLILELPTTERFSIEAEGMYAKSNVSYAYYQHDFNQYSIGGNGKFYLSKSTLQPYLGLGMTAVRYEDMSYGPMNPYYRYSQWMGAAQAIAGADLEVARKTYVGIRGQWVLPVINRPNVASNGYYAYPYYEESSLMNTTFFRVMGSVRLSF